MTHDNGAYFKSLRDPFIAITDYNSPLDKYGLRFISNSHATREPVVGDLCLVIDLDDSKSHPDKLFEVAVVRKTNQGIRGGGFLVAPGGGPMYFSDAVEDAAGIIRKRFDAR